MRPPQVRGYTIARKAAIGTPYQAADEAKAEAQMRTSQIPRSASTLTSAFSSKDLDENTAAIP
jgi:hypothetical protein